MLSPSNRIGTLFSFILFGKCKWTPLKADPQLKTVNCQPTTARPMPPPFHLSLVIDFPCIKREPHL